MEDFKSDWVSSQYNTELLVSTIQPGVKPQSDHNATYTFKIPLDLFPTIEFSQSKYIQAIYKLEVIAKVSGMHRSAKINLPIYLGSVPYKS